MLFRALFVLALGLALGACANETTPGGFNAAPALAIAPIGAVTTASLPAASTPVTGLPKKTMSDRVLTAIALERVTGLKPDPSRLSQ